MMHQAGKILRQLMVEAALDDASLSELTQVSKSNISRLKNDANSNPTLATLKPLAAFFGLSVSQLLGEAPLSKDKRHSSFSNGGFLKRIPLLAWQQLAGFINDKAVDSVEQWISCDAALSEQGFALKVNDKQLGAALPFGALLLVEPKCTLSDGDRVVVIGQRLAYLRELQIDGEHQLLRSLKLGSQLIEPLNNLSQIAGVVVEVRVSFDSEPQCSHLELAPATDLGECFA